MPPVLPPCLTTSCTSVAHLAYSSLKAQVKFGIFHKSSQLEIMPFHISSYRSSFCHLPKSQQNNAEGIKEYLSKRIKNLKKEESEERCQQFQNTEGRVSEIEVCPLDTKEKLAI